MVLKKVLRLVTMSSPPVHHRGLKVALLYTDSPAHHRPITGTYGSQHSYGQFSQESRDETADALGGCRRRCRTAKAAAANGPPAAGLDVLGDSHPESSPRGGTLSAASGVFKCERSGEHPAGRAWSFL